MGLVGMGMGTSHLTLAPSPSPCFHPRLGNWVWFCFAGPQGSTGVALMGDGWDRLCKQGPGRDKHPANTTSSQCTDWLLQTQLVPLVLRQTPALQPPFFYL